MKKLLAIKKRKILGFSLIELAVVLIIVGILLYGALAVGSAQMENNKIRATETKLDRIQDALTVYYKTYSSTPGGAALYALPCPASPTVGMGTTGLATLGFGYGNRSNDVAGTSTTLCGGTNVMRDGSTLVYVGAVPVRDLNLPDEYAFDSWGNRITYVISKNCIDKDNWVSTNTYKCSDGPTTTANGGKVSIAEGPYGNTLPLAAAYVLISHGKDRIGAWTRGSAVHLAVATKVTGSASNTTPELNNGNLSTGDGSALGNTAANVTYYDKVINDGGTPTGGGSTGNYFDDIVRFKTAPQIDYDATH